jgi:hypothetical protein
MQYRQKNWRGNRGTTTTMMMMMMMMMMRKTSHSTPFLSSGPLLTSPTLHHELHYTSLLITKVHELNMAPATPDPCVQQEMSYSSSTRSSELLLLP